MESSPPSKPLQPGTAPALGLRRLRLLGTLQAKIAAAYLMYWLRGWFRNAEQKQRLLAETHWRTAPETHAWSCTRGAANSATGKRPGAQL